MGALGLSPLGVQAVATVDAVGPEVVGFAPGDRVAMRIPGSRPGFHRIVSERDLIGIPKDVSFDDAAGLLASGLVARTILKQLHTVGRGDRVYIERDESGVDRFVTAWTRHMGAAVVTDAELATVQITAADFAAGARWRYGHGLAQLAAADVFQAMRDGAFDDLEIGVQPLSEAARVHSEIASRQVAGPFVLLPATGTIAA